MASFFDPNLLFDNPVGESCIHGKCRKNGATSCNNCVNRKQYQYGGFILTDELYDGNPNTAKNYPGNANNPIGEDIKLYNVKCSNFGSSVDGSCAGHRGAQFDANNRPLNKFVPTAGDIQNYDLDQFKAGGKITANQIKWIYQNINKEVTARLANPMYQPYTPV